MFADQHVPLEITPAYGCGFQLYCGFDDWFVGTGGVPLLLFVGGLLAKRLYELPLVGAVALAGPFATAYAIGSQGSLFEVRGPWLNHVTGLVAAFVILTAITAAVYALKRLALYAVRRKPAPGAASMQP